MQHSITQYIFRWQTLLGLGLFAVALTLFLLMNSHASHAAPFCGGVQVTNSCQKVGQYCVHCEINGCPEGTSGDPICIPDDDCSCTFDCYSNDPACNVPPPPPSPIPPPDGGPPPPPEIPSGSISASPNPCTIPLGATTCTSNITWYTEYIDRAEVVVSASGAAEAVFSTNSSCSGATCPASFIGAPPRYYDFKLYGYVDGYRQLFSQVRVTAVQATPACPSATTAFVTLAASTISVGDFTTAYAPTGWTGGNFNSSNSNIASIGSMNGATARVTGEAAGSVTITGSGWTAGNGATGCNLGPWVLFVDESELSGRVSANPNPIVVCPPERFGVTSITARASVYAEVHVFNAEGIPDNTAFFSLVDGEERTVPTGKWVRNGTVFVLIAPFDGRVELARVTVTQTQEGCIDPQGPDSWVYNSNTAGSSGLSVACDTIYAVWTPVTERVDGYSVYYLDPNTGVWTQIKKVPLAQAVVVSGGRLGATFVPAFSQTPLRYRVYTYKGNQETIARKDAAGSPIAPVLCSRGPNLDPSNKDITKIRNVELCFYSQTSPVCNLYNDQDSPTEKGLPVIEGDTISFAINLVNGGLDPITTPILVEDALTNMVEPAKGFGIRASCEDTRQCQVRDFSFNKTTKKISMRVVPIGGNSLAPKGQEAWSISLTARTQAPIDRRGQPFRVRNQAFVNSLTGPLLTTPYILVLPAGAPTVEEIQ